MSTVEPRSPKPEARGRLALLFTLSLLLFGCQPVSETASQPEEVIFWHFWGGEDRPIVEQIVVDFNASQQQYRVRAIAMPGNNLDLKFFLSVAGGDPPDLLNHDEPVIADWAHRDVLLPLGEMATPEELDRLNDWLFPAAKQLGSYDGKLYALANGLDIRALYCNQTMLEEHSLPLPRTIADLDRIAETIAPPGQQEYQRMGFLPNPDRLWAWGVVFGGTFWNPAASETRSMITADDPKNVAALEWMAGYSQRYGPSVVSSFRSGEQALTGTSFLMLADRRYAVMMDGQWRLRDLAAARDTGAGGLAVQGEEDTPQDKFTVVPLPPPPGGVKNAGWVNGNSFIVPKNSKCPQGAWEFMKFWSGLDNEARAAQACADGGWIPVSHEVVNQPAYQQALRDEPLLNVFVELASSENQHPTPPLPVAAYYLQQVKRAAQNVMFREGTATPEAVLHGAAERVRLRLEEVLHEE
ncbi:extracellular solute-binding protein [Adhaeretor mobilis]|uniref:Bacterial extracellular solute-binding protein n=1 Tax=Adhaeretor mobilis TaxID=1930276 RepID=A0A517MS85_9BACT|nr:extracellular solute-binding protein [Adhaeretor mobilis]QDS97738.1 Bacterial extracellular solute-binding protein [Adhaeretor mobilis]